MVRLFDSVLKITGFSFNIGYCSNTIDKLTQTMWYMPVNTTAQSPVSIQEEVDGSKQEQHGHRVVEETQHEDGVDAIRGAAHKEEHIRRNLEPRKRRGL